MYAHKILYQAPLLQFHTNLPFLNFSIKGFVFLDDI